LDYFDENVADGESDGKVKVTFDLMFGKAIGHYHGIIDEESLVSVSVTEILEEVEMNPKIGYLGKYSDYVDKVRKEVNKHNRFTLKNLSIDSDYYDNDSNKF